MNEVKPGWQTSEFVLSCIAALVPLLNQAFGLDLSVEAMLSIAGSVIGYAVSRGIAKKQ